MALGPRALQTFVLSQLQLQLLDGLLQRSVLAEHLLQFYFQLIVHDLRLALRSRARSRLISLGDPSLDAFNNHRTLRSQRRLHERKMRLVEKRGARKAYPSWWVHMLSDMNMKLKTTLQESDKLWRHSVHMMDTFVIKAR